MDDLTCVKMVLRSLLLSFKDGCALNSLPGAYRELDGNFIPFKQFGYITLRQFLQHISDVARLGRNRDGEDVVFGVANDETAHIQKMVQKQKSKKSKSRQGREKFRGRPFRPRFPARPQPRGPIPTMFRTGSHGPRDPPPRPGVFDRTIHCSNVGPLLAQSRKDTDTPAQKKPLLSTPTKNIYLPPRLQRNLHHGVNHIKSEFRIKQATLPSPGDSIGVTVRHIQDAHNFYVDVDKSNIDNLMKAIQKRMSNVTSELQSQGSVENMVGAFCLARYSRDNYWYRAQIISCYINDKFVPVLLVSFVDFGNSEKRTLQDLWPITSEECGVPAQCVKCSLYALLPRNISWSNDCNMELQKMLDGREVNMVVNRIIIDDEICEVTLTVQGLNINRRLVELHLARSKNLEPLPLQPPDEDFPMVYVSYFERTTAVVMRYIGGDYSVALEELEARMLKAYGNTEYSPNEFAINVGGVYAALSVTNDIPSACRVCLLRRRETVIGHVVDCYFPDHGDTETIKVQRLRWLRDEFRQLPFQAVTFNMRGLELYETNQFILELMVRELLGTEFAMEVDSDDPTDKTVTLYDIDMDQNMNEWLLGELPDCDLEQKLAEPDSTYGADAITVKILNIREDGTVSVRFPGEGERRYTLLEKDLQEHMNQNQYEPIPHDCSRRGERVVAMYEDDDGSATWYRAVILDVAGEQVEVEFVDYGNVATVNKDHIHALKQLVLGSRLETLPIQRKEVRLAGFPTGERWTAQATEALGFILDPDEKFQLRVEKLPGHGEAEVTMYGYTDEGKLFCVNDYLLEIDDLFISTPTISAASSVSDIGQNVSNKNMNVALPTRQLDEGLAKSFDRNLEALKRLTLEVMHYFSRSLPNTVAIVGKGSFMPVHVPWAKDPSNFACIPVASFDDLSALVDNMNEHYRTCQRIGIEIKPKYMYAACHENSWYRVITKDVFTEEQKVSVHFVDFGDFQLIDMDNLQPLEGLYQEIPKMSFNAKLGGLAPERGIWDENKCRAFSEMVVDKNLHCLILDKENIESGPVLVDLVCTNTISDICVSQRLLQSRLARQCRV